MKSSPSSGYTVHLLQAAYTAEQRDCSKVGAGKRCKPGWGSGHPAPAAPDLSMPTMPSLLAAAAVFAAAAAAATCAATAAADADATTPAQLGTCTVPAALGAPAAAAAAAAAAWSTAAEAEAAACWCPAAPCACWAANSSTAQDGLEAWARLEDWL